MNISGHGMQVPNNQHLHMHELRRYDFPIFWFDFLYISADYNCIAQVFSFLLLPLFPPLYNSFSINRLRFSYSQQYQYPNSNGEQKTIIVFNRFASGLFNLDVLSTYDAWIC
jgi:hypothetical protein